MHSFAENGTEVPLYLSARYKGSTYNKANVIQTKKRKARNEGEFGVNQQKRMHRRQIAGTNTNANDHSNKKYKKIMHRNDRVVNTTEIYKILRDQRLKNHRVNPRMLNLYGMRHKQQTTQKRHKFTHQEILKASLDNLSKFIIVLGGNDPLDVPWWVYVIMHTQKEKRFKCRTHVGRSKNPFRKEMLHNLKALKKCKVTRPAAGYWKLCMVVGPFFSEHRACKVVKEWRKSKRAEYGRHSYGMKLCMNSNGKLLCFSNLLMDDIPIHTLKELPPEYLTPFKSSLIGKKDIALLLNDPSVIKNHENKIHKEMNNEGV